MTRRQALVAAAGTLTVASAQAPRSKMGIATTSYMTFARYRDTMQFLDHCDRLGAGGIQASLTSVEPAFVKELRSKLEKKGMFLEVMIGLPRQDLAQFESIVKAAKEAGALCVRAACLGGRRYETFSSLADWQKFVADSHAAIERALPIVEKHKMPFALENHKDWTVDEFVALLKKYSSPHLGVCVDLGNNISLLDDPMELVERLAPFAMSTHIKDMGVEETANGFLLSELPLGEGMLDLPKMVRTIHAAKPNVRLTLEMITRDPLVVPCLTDKYWATFPDRNGIYLARTMAMVRANKPKQPLPRVTPLDKQSQLNVEEENVKHCLHYSRQKLEA